jgi:hypothetical protein
MKPVTTREIIWDARNCPIDMFDVEWVTFNPDREEAIQKLVEALEKTIKYEGCHGTVYAREALANWKKANE